MLAPGAARADADPASDILYVRSLFLPYTEKPSPAVEAKLDAAIKHAAETGKPIRVALIGAPTDLGGVPTFFGKPVEYAQFLGSELQLIYTGLLLVVMPQGAALAKNGELVADKVVLDAKPGPGGDGLAKTATDLVQILSGAKQAPASSSGSGGAPWLVIAIAAGVVAVLAIALAVVLRRRRP